MPYDIAKGFDGCAYAVVKLTPDGRELAPGGCHQTAIEAGKHLAALQAATASEVRHPGHGDQSVHNPRKGAGGAYAIGAAGVATPAQEAGRMLDNDAKFKASGGSVVTGDQITKKEAEAQVKRLEAESESVFPPSTETGRHGLVPPAIAAQNKVYRMPDGPEKDLARKEVD